MTSLRLLQMFCRRFWIGSSSSWATTLRASFSVQRTVSACSACVGGECGRKGGRHGMGMGWARRAGIFQGMDKPHRWVLRVVFPLLAPSSADPGGKFQGLATRRRQTIAARMLLQRTRRRRHDLSAKQEAQNGGGVKGQGERAPARSLTKLGGSIAGPGSERVLRDRLPWKRRWLNCLGSRGSACALHRRMGFPDSLVTEGRERADCNVPRHSSRWEMDKCRPSTVAAWHLSKDRNMLLTQAAP